MFEKREFLKDLLKQTTRLFNGHWLCFTVIVAVYIVPVILIDTFFWDNQGLILKLINKLSVNSLAVFDYGIYFILAILFFLTLAALIRAIGTAGAGGTPNVLESYAQGVRILDSYLWVKFLFVFKVLCWSLLFVVPGIVFGVLYNFSGMAAAVDGKRGMEALRDSRAIINANLSDYLYCVVLTLTVSVLMCVIGVIFLDSVMLSAGQGAQSLAGKGIGLLKIILIGVTGIYFLIFYYYLYVALRDRGRVR